MVCHTVGFHRAVYGRPSVLRKIGGRVPEEWGEVAWGGPYAEALEKVTTLSSLREPLDADARGRVQEFRLERRGARICFSVNGALLHDWTESGQYPYYREALHGGRMGFRNFGGVAEDFYGRLRVESL